MRVVVLHNPRSGRGLARSLSGKIERRLTARGHTVKPLMVSGEEQLDPVRLASADALVIVGGDGTVTYTADAASKADTPIYHAPTGNENLFAREFGMSRNPAAVVRTIERDHRARMDIGLCNGHPFLIMTSAGPDAGVIRRLTERRTKAIGHLAYIQPMLREIVSPTIPTLSVFVDNQPIVDNTRGMVIVANIRQYALGINPCRRAQPDNGLLDVVFFPMQSTTRALLWLTRSKLRRPIEQLGAVASRGTRIRIVFENHAGVCQMDGEHRPDMFNDKEKPQLDLSLSPGALPVLVP